MAQRKVHYKRTIFLVFLTLTMFFMVQPVILAQKAADDCSWQSESKLRKAVKTRTAAQGAGYEKVKNGAPLTVEEWYSMACELDSRIPAEVPDDKALEGLETRKVTLRGYVLATRFERDDDHDLHVELASSPDWNSDHVVLEMSAGNEYCHARKAIWDLVRREGGNGDLWIFKRPVEVEVTGFVLLGRTKGSAPLCRLPLSNGVAKSGEIRAVGAWRLQPVLSVKAIIPEKKRRA